mmetsp:Transcript_14734/g.32693  ORF Transcript_14734/g.32693 Transcript_14734/m.32693 type:complete len:344 (-) Transcript_14734:471-1502(-)
MPGVAAGHSCQNCGTDALTTPGLKRLLQLRLHRPVVLRLRRPHRHAARHPPGLPAHRRHHHPGPPVLTPVLPVPALAALVLPVGPLVHLHPAPQQAPEPAVGEEVREVSGLETGAEQGEPSVVVRYVLVEPPGVGGGLRSTEGLVQDGCGGCASVCYLGHGPVELNHHSLLGRESHGQRPVPPLHRLQPGHKRRKPLLVGPYAQQPVRPFGRGGAEHPPLLCCWNGDLRAGRGGQGVERGEAGDGALEDPAGYGEDRPDCLALRVLKQNLVGDQSVYSPYLTPRPSEPHKLPDHLLPQGRAPVQVQESQATRGVAPPEAPDRCTPGQLQGLKLRRLADPSHLH